MKNLLFVTALAVLFANCSQILPPTMYSPKAMNELTTDLKKISENYKIEEVRIFEKDKLSDEFGMAVVYMRNSEGQKFEQVLYYNFGIPHNDPKPKKEYGIKKTEPHAVNVEDIIKQKDNIEKYVETAKVQINEDFEGQYKFESVTDLIFTADDKGSLQIKFTVNVTEKGKSERREGGRMVIDYWGIDFHVDTDGNVIMEELN
jgi:hypothetical protein